MIKLHNFLVFQDSLSDLGLFNLPPAAGQRLMSMAVSMFFNGVFFQDKRLFSMFFRIAILNDKIA